MMDFIENHLTIIHYVLAILGAIPILITLIKAHQYKKRAQVLPEELKENAYKSIKSTQFFAIGSTILLAVALYFIGSYTFFFIWLATILVSMYGIESLSDFEE